MTTTISEWRLNSPELDIAMYETKEVTVDEKSGYVTIFSFNKNGNNILSDMIMLNPDEVKGLIEALKGVKQ